VKERTWSSNWREPGL